MPAIEFHDPALHVALALVAGIVAQTLARHLRVPGIVVLLGTGVLLGPDVLGIIDPGLLSGTLHTLVGFAVAVILFEGGMNLDLRRLRREARSIRQLVTVGALVTLIGGTLAARLLLGWNWTTSFLFGSLVIVTGPTVITPLLRRIKVQRKVGTVLEAEGILVDAIGAIFAAVALQFAVRPSGQAAAEAAVDLLARLGFGAALGLAGGMLIAQLLRLEKIVPDGLENVFTLTLVVALFHLANAVFHESGIMTVTVAGLVVGNVHTRALPDLLEFKEQLTVMLIGLLFVLLAADVRVTEVLALGAGGVAVVLALMFVVRPLNILVGTLGSDLSWRDKAFLSWVAPRGIIAAAGASLFADTLSQAHIGQAHELRALVFLVIAATVLLQGLSGGLVAQVLGLRRPANSGYAIVGANHLARAFARVFAHSGNDCVLLESNAEVCTEAEREGYRVLFGSGLRDTLMARAEMDTRAGCLGVTTNEAVNMLFARRAREDFHVPLAWVALRRGHTNVTPEMVHKAGARVLFGEPRYLDLWIIRLERGLGVVEIWERSSGDPSSEIELQQLRELHRAMLPLAVVRGKRLLVFDEEVGFRAGDRLYLVMFQERRDLGATWLAQQGWEFQENLPPEAQQARAAD